MPDGLFGWVRLRLKKKQPAQSTTPEPEKKPEAVETQDDHSELENRLYELRVNLRHLLNDIITTGPCQRVVTPIQLHVSIATFNVGDKIPRSSEGYRNWITAKQGRVADLIVVGLQEVDMSAGAILLEGQSAKAAVWDSYLSEEVAKVGEYRKIVYNEMAGLVLLIFIKEGLVDGCANIRKCVVRIGKVGLGNKGAVAARLTCFGKKFLFVNSHLEAHTDQYTRRNKGYERILSELKFDMESHRDDPVDMIWPVSCPFSSSRDAALPLAVAMAQKVFQDDEDLIGRASVNSAESISDGATPPLNNSAAPQDVEYRPLAPLANLQDYDYVFWFGDLNYRLWGIGNREIREKIARNKLDELLKYDQLRQANVTDESFSGFSECPIRFSPTYKFDVGTMNYDSSTKQREPSWTDRILWKCNQTSSFVVDSFEHQHTSRALPIAIANSFKSCVDYSSFIDRASPRMFSKYEIRKSPQTLEGVPICHSPISDGGMDDTKSLGYYAGDRKYCPNLNNAPLASSAPLNDEPSIEHAHPGAMRSLPVFLNTPSEDVGVRFSFDGGVATVAEVLPEGLAARAGVCDGMRLQSAEGIFLQSLEDVQRMLASGPLCMNFEVHDRIPEETSDILPHECSMRTVKDHHEDPHPQGFRTLQQRLSAVHMMACIEPDEMSYDSHQILLSDHLPVSAAFKATSHKFDTILSAELLQEAIEHNPHVKALMDEIMELEKKRGL